MMHNSQPPLLVTFSAYVHFLAYQYQAICSSSLTYNLNKQVIVFEIPYGFIYILQKQKEMIQNMEIGHHFTLLSVLREERDRLKNVEAYNRTLDIKNKNITQYIGDRQKTIKQYQTVISRNLQKQLQQNYEALLQTKQKINNLERQFNQCLSSLQNNIKEIRSRKSMVQKVEQMAESISAQTSQSKQNQEKLLQIIESRQKEIADLNQVYEEYKGQVLIGQERRGIAQHQKNAQIMLYNSQCQNLRKKQNENLMVSTKNGDLQDMLALFENKIENMTKDNLEVCEAITQIQTNKNKVQQQIEQMNRQIQIRDQELSTQMSSVQSNTQQKNRITSLCKQIQGKIILIKTSHSAINRKSSQTLNKVSSIQLLQQLLHKVTRQIKQ